ncbi:unnamed protein product [Paramecium sonneborni]|uniref:RING-type domain-containing protein n=1 Tax=Paramecium sonneborni TaxID=65129 RepID=A0A8S1Q8Y7_9CILI|nr:unnamed protein product [Paramecium sonneborni]
MDAQIQVSSEDFEVNSAQRNTSQSDQSDDLENMMQFSKQKKTNKRQSKQNLPNIKRVIQKRDNKMTNKQQLQYKEMPNNQQKMNLKKKSSLSNQFAEVFEDNLLANTQQKNKIEQVFQVQQKFEHKIQEKNQQNYQGLENDKNVSIQQPQQEQLDVNNLQQIEVNNIQQNQLPNYLNNTGQFQYLRTALSKNIKHQPLLFKRFLNFLQMTQEEYDHIKQSFPEIPPDFLPQFILEQRQINKAFQNNQNQQQQQQQQQINQVLQNQFRQQQQQLNNQFMLNQQYQQQQNFQFFQNQQQQQNQIQQHQEQEERNFIETEFKFNPQLSDGNLECAICAQTYLNGEKLAILLCIHRFHLNCFTSWMQKSPLCPICHHG